MQYFSKRRKGSVWSAKNKKSVNELIKNNLMQNAGLRVIERAKQDGTYFILDDIEKMLIPKELEEAFKKNPTARKKFEESTKLDKRRVLHPLAILKQETSRKRHVEKIMKYLS